MVLFGGSFNFTSNEHVYRLSLKTLQWSQLKTKPQADITPKSLDEHTAVVHKDSMLVFGGFDNGFRSNKVHRLNLNTNAWEYLRVSGPEPCPRSGHSAVISADLMIVFGGKDDENEKLNDVWIFDILAQTWKQVIYAEGALKPTARSGHSALLFNN